MLQKKSQKIAKNYECITCDYFTCKYSDYVKHLSTLKHTNKLNATLLLQNATTISDKINTTYACECGKKYNHSSSYYRHKKSCEPEPLENNDLDDPENLIKYLMKENAEFKQLLIDHNKQMMAQNNNMMSQNDRIIELSKNAGNNNNNNSNNNNSFNLNMYLNETCKDALNIMDFVNQLKIGLTELEETGRLGFANGISKIFIDGLKQIDINNRPVHCSTETLYIKSNNEWNKEDGERKILTSALKHVAHKNITQISEWTKVHPDYNDSDSKENDKFLQIVSEAMSGSTQDETIKNYNKIIKNIVKETVIEKIQ